MFLIRLWKGCLVFFIEETQCCVYLMLISAWVWQSWGEAIAWSLTHPSLLCCTPQERTWHHKSAQTQKLILRRLSLWAMLFPHVSNYKIKFKFKQYLKPQTSKGVQEYEGPTDAFVTPEIKSVHSALLHCSHLFTICYDRLVPYIVAVHSSVRISAAATIKTMWRKCSRRSPPKSGESCSLLSVAHLICCIVTCYIFLLTSLQPKRLQPCFILCVILSLYTAEAQRQLFSPNKRLGFT